MTKISWQPDPEMRRRLSAAPASETKARREELQAARGGRGANPVVRLAVAGNPRRPGTRAATAFEEMRRILAAGPLTKTELLRRCETYDKNDLRHDAALGHVVEVQREGDQSR